MSHDKPNDGQPIFTRQEIMCPSCRYVYTIFTTMIQPEYFKLQSELANLNEKLRVAVEALRKIKKETRAPSTWEEFMDNVERLSTEALQKIEAMK